MKWNIWKLTTVFVFRTQTFTRIEFWLYMSDRLFSVVSVSMIISCNFLKFSRLWHLKAIKGAHPCSLHVHIFSGKANTRNRTMCRLHLKFFQGKYAYTQMYVCVCNWRRYNRIFYTVMSDFLWMAFLAFIRTVRTLSAEYQNWNFWKPFSLWAGGVKRVRGEILFHVFTSIFIEKNGATYERVDIFLNQWNAVIFQLFLKI